MAYINSAYEACDMIVELLKTKQGELGLGFVGSYDEKRLPSYPAVVVSPSARTKALQGVSQFAIDLAVDIWVYHGDMTVPHAVRNREDLIFVHKIEAVLEDDYTFGNRIIFGFVMDEQPGLYQPNSSKNTEIIAGTRMRWVGTSRRLLRG